MRYDKCPKHPKYQVKRAPSGECPICWAMWYSDAKCHRYEREVEIEAKRK